MAYYKVVATVVKVSDPKSLTPGEPPHVALPCRMYEVGDKIVVQDNQINMAETTGAMCVSLLCNIIPHLRLMQRSVEPLIDEKTGEKLSDSTAKATWFSCPDAERPVIFKMERIPLKGKPGWVIAEDVALKNPGKKIHMHLPNPVDRARGVNNNMGEEIEGYAD